MVDENEEFVLGKDVTAQAKSKSRGDTVVIAARLSVEEFSQLEATCSATGKTMSQAVREAIGEWLRSSRRREPTVTVFFGGVTTSIGAKEMEGQAVVIRPEHEEPATTFVGR